MCTDVETAPTGRFTQLVALTTYARNEQVKGSIPLGGSGLPPADSRQVGGRYDPPVHGDGYQ